MNDPIVSRDAILRTYQKGREAGLDPTAAVEHAAGVHFVDPVHVESTVQGREALQQAMGLQG